MIAGILFISLILFLLLSVPIGVSLGLSSLAVITTQNPISMETFVQAMIQGLNSFPLMAVPLFTFAGEVMGKGGISKRLIDVSSLLTGRFTGGLGIVTIITSLFFAAIAGTGSAAVAAIGLIMIPTMVTKGYDKGYASALVATAGTVGVIIPPSVCMVVYAVAAGASISGLFMAGIVPGILIGIGLIIYSVIYSKKHGYKGENKKYTAKEAAKTIISAIPGLMMPVIILGGIYGGIFTPTEAAAIAGIYGVLIGIYVYKEIKYQDLLYLAFRSVLMSAPVLMIIGISTGFGRILTITQVPAAIANMILGITNSKILVLLLINVLLLIVGTFMETNAAIIILTPILLPIVTMLGVDLIHFGIIVVMNLSIGFITPPLGANLFMACQVGEISFDELVKKIWPWIFVMIVLLMMITYIPEISLCLPKALGMI
ncbi:TRAP transporter large permease [Hominiventricola filiformis]|uniref:TRAP transporter large permease n=1 Tax=Hominiventricola filiformis TaxID=2885352 RepID=A0AAE3A7S3_9FIRM|nr:TRAP transporter large permease [Hominiventricola filiformis]MCC2127472.1 TRAP transporter large permease [Hominiventricola filiformis]